MIRPLVLDGITYNKQYVEGLKQPLLAVRDCLIAADKLPYAAALSEIHALLEHYVQNVNDKPLSYVGEEHNEAVKRLPK